MFSLGFIQGILEWLNNDVNGLMSFQLILLLTIRHGVNYKNIPNKAKNYNNYVDRDQWVLNNQNLHYPASVLKLIN